MMFKFVPYVLLLNLMLFFTVVTDRKEIYPVALTTASPNDTGMWQEAVQSQIAAQEYQLRRQPEAATFSSPNRQNNLRITYRENGFSLQQRVDRFSIWQMNYTVGGVYRGNKKVLDLPAFPSAEVCGTTLEQNFGNGFQIQYQNGPEGMRQNFLVEHKPVGKGPLKVRLQTNGTLFPVKMGQNAVVLVEANRMTGALQNRTWYKDLRVWDANGMDVSASMQVGEPQWDPASGDWNSTIDLQVEDQHAAYPLWIDPISTTAATVMESNQADAWFGYSVASAGDVNADGYSDMIIGAPTYDDGQVDEGAAFVFHGSATGIGLTSITSMESDQVNGFCGVSCATAGDVNGDGYSDVIVGMSQYNKGHVREGIAVVYYGSANGISTIGADTLETNQANAFFGQSVACAGDVNGDGYSDVIVGAPSYDNGQTNEGIACVYHGSSNGLITTPAALMESDQADAKLGVSVASAGDVNGDGYSDGIVGAYLYDNGQSDEGRAYIYLGAITGLSTVASATLESNQANAQLGVSVASAGDVNGDGYSDIVVGSPSYGNGQAWEGVAFVYAGSNSGIVTNACTLLESNQSNSVFGLTVASAGDVNGDGLADVIVGANYYTNGQNSEGAAFLYYGNLAGIDVDAGAVFEGNQADASMGVSVASVGDVNGDGFSDVAVGANFYDLGQSDEGATFVYHGAARGVSTTPEAAFEVNQAAANLGCSVASAGDVNGDGYSDMIIGANRFDNGQTDEGAAFLYHGGPLGLGPSFATQLECNQANANFGFAVAGAGDVNGDGYGDVVVGADFYDNGQLDEGALFVYQGSATGILSSPVRRMESDQAGARLGYAVASAGDINGDGYADVIAGAPYFDNNENDEGAAFTYHGDSAGIITTFSHRIESNQVGALLGGSVASAGDVNGDGKSDVIVGAIAYDQGQTDEGAAFVHHGSVLGINVVAATVLEMNQPNANMGQDVASAGDVNGDGFSDVIVGASRYDNGQTDEGAAFVYYGTAGGIIPVLGGMLECNQAAANMGFSVSAAGDLNGDGYGDVVVGADKFGNGQATEGAAFVFDGSPNGILTSFSASLESNQAGAQLGQSVASAGDVNGDGYSDLVIGALNYDNGQTDEGTAMVFVGNGGQGRRVLCQQRRVGGPQAVGPGGLTGTVGQARFTMVAKSFLGRQDGVLAWEVVQNGDPFSSAGGFVSNSLAATGMGTIYTPLAATGTAFSQIVSGFNTQLDYKWRVRVRYKLPNAITGQIYGPWYYPKNASPEVPMMGFKPRACPIDNNPPTALCQGLTVELDSNGNATVVADSVNNGSTDNCNIAGFSLSPNTFTCANLGNNIVTLTVMDGVGNTSTCAANLNIVAFPL
jgi:hypothetical protein